MSVALCAAGCAVGASDPSDNPGFTSLGPPTTATEGDSTSGGTSDETSNDVDPTTGPQPTTTDDPSGTPTSAETTDGTSGSTGTDTADTGLPCQTVEDCDDGDACTLDTCLGSGSCSSSPVNCDDGLDCTADSCDPVTGQCNHATNDALCDDGDACTGIESCDAAAGCQSGTAVVCNDQNACTVNECNPADGSCSYPAVDTCNGGDQCCPLGCSVQQDNDCTCTNIAPSASPSSSGGGSNATGYGPSEWTDGVNEAGCAAASCQECFGWISNGASPDGAYMQLTWGNQVTIGSMVLDANAAAEACSAGFGRWPYSGQVQYWNGASWIGAGSWSQVQGNIAFDFDPPLQTTQLRLYDVVTPPGGLNSLAYEWYVYEPLGCSP